METSISYSNNQEKGKPEVPSERLIYQNRDIYIKLGENDSDDTSIDITEKIKDYAKSIFSLKLDLKLGEMIYSKDFNLLNSMNSLEIGHPKMDLHFDFQKAITYKKAISTNQIKDYKNLEYIDIINLVDHLMTKEVLWLSGASPLQTIFTFMLKIY